MHQIPPTAVEIQQGRIFSRDADLLGGCLLCTRRICFRITRSEERDTGKSANETRDLTPLLTHLFPITLNYLEIFSMRILKADILTIYSLDFNLFHFFLENKHYSCIFRAPMSNLCSVVIFLEIFSKSNIFLNIFILNYFFLANYVFKIKYTICCLYMVFIKSF